MTNEYIAFTHSGELVHPNKRRRVLLRERVRFYISETGQRFCKKSGRALSPGTLETLDVNTLKPVAP